MQLYEILEQRWAEFNQLDPKGMVVCSSGTAALHLALETLRSPVCFLPDYTMIACARAVALAEMAPVLCDCADPAQFWRMLIPQTLNQYGGGAVMGVHIYGYPPGMEQLADFADERDLFLIEDLAEAHGVKPHKETDAACWSFYQNKIIAGEEGGAVWFRYPEQAAHARCLRSLGFTPAHDYRHIPRGHNYRLANTLAELVLDSVTNYPLNLINRWLRWEKLNATVPAEWRLPKPAAPWVFPFRVPGLTDKAQDRAILALRGQGIAARHGFRPLHTQAEFRDCGRVGGENAERAAREVIYLPLRPGFDEKLAFDLVKPWLPF